MTLQSDTLLPPRTVAQEAPHYVNLLLYYAVGWMDVTEIFTVYPRVTVLNGIGTLHATPNRFFDRLQLLVVNGAGKRHRLSLAAAVSSIPCFSPRTRSLVGIILKAVLVYHHE